MADPVAGHFPVPRRMAGGKAQARPTFSLQLVRPFSYARGANSVTGRCDFTQFLVKSKILLKVYTLKYWKPKSRPPRAVFILRPRHLDFIYRGTRGVWSLKKKLQPLRRFTPEIDFLGLLFSFVSLVG